MTFLKHQVLHWLVARALLFMNLHSCLIWCLNVIVIERIRPRNGPDPTSVNKPDYNVRLAILDIRINSRCNPFIGLKFSHSSIGETPEWGPCIGAHASRIQIGSSSGDVLVYRAVNYGVSSPIGSWNIRNPRYCEIAFKQTNSPARERYRIGSNPILFPKCHCGGYRWKRTRSWTSTRIVLTVTVRPGTIYLKFLSNKAAGTRCSINAHFECHRIVSYIKPILIDKEVEIACRKSCAATLFF